MDPSVALVRELDVLERVQRDIGAISQRTDEARKRELVRLRRVLAEHIGQVGVIGDAVFEAAADPRLVGEFRSRLSVMRNAIALHQASWPAVALDSADDDFTRSFVAARVAKESFLSWTRAALADMRDARA